MSRYPVPLTGLFIILSALRLVAEIPSGTSISTELRFTELSRKVVDMGDHKIAFVRVRPPVLPAQPPPPPVREPTEKEIATAERMEKKAHATLNITATVYLYNNRTITELKWRNEDTGNLEYVAYSSADFRYLTQLNYLESETTVYSWFPFVYECDLAELSPDEKPPFPSDFSFSDGETEYFVDSRAKSVEGEGVTLAGLDYIHAYYKLHYADLKADYEKRVADNAERERVLRESPPKKSDQTIYFWVIKNRLNR